MSSGTRVLFEIIAGNLASFFAAMGALYNAARYVGYVDVGMGLTGIKGAQPFGLHAWGESAFTGPAPRRTARVSAAEFERRSEGRLAIADPAVPRRYARPLLHPLRRSGNPGSPLQRRILLGCSISAPARRAKRSGGDAARCYLRGAMTEWTLGGRSVVVCPRGSASPAQPSKSRAST
jgi:hypothetical protein